MTDIKTMQLYPAPERIFRDLEDKGFAGPVPPEILAGFDQLHYHGAAAVDVAIERLGIGRDARVLEVGSGWGGPSRWVAHRTGARVEAVELQPDYDGVARTLTQRAGLDGLVRHICGDFLQVGLDGTFDHVVSWLALYHIPDRPRYLHRIRQALNPGGGLWIEDLALARPLHPEEAEDFARAMFPNSIVLAQDYGADLSAAGFEAVDVTDMTTDWGAFVARRLAAFRENRSDYARRHGAEGFDALEAFYSAVAGYFESGLLAGVRVQARAGG